MNSAVLVLCITIFKTKMFIVIIYTDMTGVEEVRLCRPCCDSSRVDELSPDTNGAAPGAVEEDLKSGKEELVTEGARPIQIVVANEDDHKFELDAVALEKILMVDHIKDLNVVVLSVAGAFRKGKSFLLDFMLRYMHNQVSYGCFSMLTHAFKIICMLSLNVALVFTCIS